jgi:TonB family protein
VFEVPNFVTKIMTLRHPRTIWLCFLPFFSLQAAEEETNIVDIEGFERAEPILKKNPRYPSKKQIMGEVGWTIVNYMVDPSGNTYDITVRSSSGDSLFDKAAIKAAEKYKYKPASVDGVSVDSSYSTTITFDLSGSENAVTKDFRSYMKLFLSSYSEDNEKRADYRLSKMKRVRAVSHYQLEALAFAEALYQDKWGSKEQALTEFKRTKRYKVLPDSWRRTADLNIYRLQFELRKFVAARKTFLNLDEAVGEEDKEDLLRFEQEINRLETSGKPFRVPGEINSYNEWWHSPLRPIFSFTNIEGRLGEVRLHCDAKYVGFGFIEPKKHYRIDPSHGSCRIKISGTEGATFDLIERLPKT